MFSAGFASDLCPFFLNLPVINSTRGAHYPHYTHVQGGFLHLGDVRGDKHSYKWVLFGSYLGYLFRNRG